MNQIIIRGDFTSLPDKVRGFIKNGYKITSEMIVLPNSNRAYIILEKPT